MPFNVQTFEVNSLTTPLTEFLDISTSEDLSVNGAQPSLDIKAIAVHTGAKWPQLAKELGLSSEDIEMVAQEPLAHYRTQTEADQKRCEHMLALWTQRSAAAGIPNVENLGKLSTSNLFMSFL